jgi:hypothetical protein
MLMRGRLVGACGINDMMLEEQHFILIAPAGFTKR